MLRKARSDPSGCRATTTVSPRDVERLERARLRQLDAQGGEDGAPPEQDVDLGRELGRVEVGGGRLLVGGFGLFVGARRDQLEAPAGHIERRGVPLAGTMPEFSRLVALTGVSDIVMAPPRRPRETGTATGPFLHCQCSVADPGWSVNTPSVLSADTGYRAGWPIAFRRTACDEGRRAPACCPDAPARLGQGDADGDSGCRVKAWPCAGSTIQLPDRRRAH